MEQRASVKAMRWLPTLYFAKGILHVIVFTVSLIMLRQMGLDNTAVTVCVSFCYLPWVTKFYWKSLFSKPKYCWHVILLAELLLVPLFSLLAFSLSEVVKSGTLLVLIAFLTAIHNVSADAFYRSELVSLSLVSSRTVRELSRKLADVVGLGVIVMVVGNLQVVYRNAQLYSWRSAMFCVALFFLLLFFWHLLVLPRTTKSAKGRKTQPAACPLSMAEVVFLLFYLLVPTMQGKMSVLFLISSQSSGGLGLAPQELGFVLGTVGVIGSAFGILAGRKLSLRYGFQRTMLPLGMLFFVPSLIYAMLAFWQPDALLLVWACVFVEQTAFGMGVSVWLTYLEMKTRKNLAKSLMSLSMMAGCGLAGFLQASSSYCQFFILTLSGCLLTVVAVYSLYRDSSEREGERTEKVNI